MDTLGVTPGTGPNTLPLPVIRRATRPRTVADLPTGRTLVMGILNVTPDSFSDGGDHSTRGAAIDHGLRLHFAGADIVDVGGESTRPGAAEVPVEAELDRVVPVITALARAGALVSIDTRRPQVAAAAIDAGAALVNDVSGTAVHPDMPALIAQRGVHYVLQHSRGDSRTMTSRAQYDDVVEDVIAELAPLAGRFIDAGVAEDRLILDPGIGFAKAGEQNWQLLRSLDRFTALGKKVLVGTSRKTFLGELLASSGKSAPPKDRDAATVASTALAAAAGVWAVRVHDVKANLDAVKVAAAWSGR
ncbi:dihydropteroate synthase [Tersicoccus solisilvae]|uniref:Dihydropteroate synthase n=1 Tax=Tersicoccus solisilvae TaxID=1882339 RepID=A0ABQ1P9V6_9MICC|nr:dihydropteroate synthase [Tersicoccus solisilvae]GGC93611.1 dihydropteroate synthase [Tersicoccus solisilvae]